MQKPLILNPILTRIHRNDQEVYLKSKIRHIKPIVDSKCPESFFYLQNKFSKSQKNNWNGIKINMNTNCLKNFKFTPKNKKHKLKTKFRPLFKYDHDFLSYWRKEELLNIAIENLNIYNRLNAKKGSYALKKHLKDYEKAQYYKKNYCKYPSIDFYRTSKTNNDSRCSIFNYCTFYNYKTINEKISNEYLKRTNSQIMHKTKSVSELFNLEGGVGRKTFQLTPFKKKIKNEEQKYGDNNIFPNKKYTKFNNLRNNICSNSGNNKDIKKEIKKQYYSEDINNNIINEEDNNIEQSYKSNNEEKTKKDIESNNINNNEDVFNTGDNIDIMINENNKGNSVDKEEISEKIEGDENNKEQNSYKKDENNKEDKGKNKKEEKWDIVESIENEKDKNKIEEINKIKNEEKKAEDNNDEDKFITNVLEEE